MTAFGMYCMRVPAICAAAQRILEENGGAAARMPEEPAETEVAPASNSHPQDPDHTESPGPTETSVTEDPAAEDPGPTEAPAAEDGPQTTVEQVRARGIAASRQYGKEAVVAILQKFGAPSISALAEGDRAAFLAELDGLGGGDA